MGIDIETLIDAIEVKPALYKKDIKEYIDIEFRNKCWGEVCSCVYRDWKDLGSKEKAARVDEVKKKWKNLRTCFTKELRDQKAIKTGKYGHNKRRKYIYFDRLRFLQPSLQENDTPIIIKVEGVEEDKEREKENKEREEEYKEESIVEGIEVKEEEEDVTLYEEEDDDVTLFEEEKEEESQVEKQNKRKPTHRRQLILPKKASLLQRRTNNLQKKMVALLKTNELQIKKTPSKTKTLENGVYEIKNSEDDIREMFGVTSSSSNTDEETHFALSIVPLLRKLNDDIKLEAQIEILNLLKKFNQKQRLYGFSY